MWKWVSISLRDFRNCFHPSITKKEFCSFFNCSIKESISTFKITKELDKSGAGMSLCLNFRSERFWENTAKAIRISTNNGQRHLLMSFEASKLSKFKRIFLNICSCSLHRLITSSGSASDSDCWPMVFEKISSAWITVANGLIVQG